MLDRITHPVAASGGHCSDPMHPSVQKHALSARGLSFNARNVTLLRDINLSFSASGITAVMGFNGAGKSLLLRLLNGLIAPTKGVVLWDDEPLTDALRARQAFVFQKPVILRRTVLANVRFALAARGDDDMALVLTSLEKVGLAHLADRPARLLSGGEKQRLALAQALAVKPEVLLLDEATASLDPASIAVIEQVVGEAASQGTKIIMVTHDIGQAKRLADEIVFVHAGEVVEVCEATGFFEAPRSTAAKAYLSGQLPPELASSRQKQR